METNLRANLGHGGGAFLLTLALCLFPREGLAQDPVESPEAPDASVQSADDIAVELPATEARIEALQKLASGEYPGVPLDTLLNVSLDDDSSMMERDRAVRLTRRRVLIASRVAERFKNKSDEEMAQMRDQILAMDLERKVLALPIEVRSRLVDLDAEGGAPGEAGETPREQGKLSAPVEAKKPVSAPTHAAQVQAKETSSQATNASSERGVAEERAQQRMTWRNVLTFLGCLLLTWLLARLVGAALARIGGRISLRRAQFEQLASFSRLPIYGLGFLLSVAFAFPLSPELMFVLFGTLALTLALACKDLVASLVSGFVIALTRPFQVGDRIALGDVQGKVTEVGPSETRLLTPQNRLVIIPNNALLTKWVSAVQASSAMTPLQLDFFIDASQDIAGAKRIVEETIQITRSIEMPKGQTILVKQLLTDRGLTVRLRTKVFVMGSQSQDEVESELTERVLETLRTSGIRAASGQAASAR